MRLTMPKIVYFRIGDSDTLRSLCHDFNTEPAKILRNNPALPLYTGEWVRIERNDYLTYHVRPTETLSDIAEKFGIEKEKIKADNHLMGEKLFIGQAIKIYKDEPS